MQEVSELQKRGVKVLGRRHLERYLLDPEMVELFCEHQDQPERKACTAAGELM